MALKGYMGKILHADLTSGKIFTENLDPKTARLFLGGSGLGTKILFRKTDKDTDPLGPENVIVFAVGPVTGSGAWNSDRFHVVSKSPLTGIIGEASAGGYWGGKFKKCGYDALIITGASAKPVYISISDEKAEIKDAAGVWGKDTFETTDILKGAEGKNAKAAVIGQAGENLVRFANIISDGRHGRASGRCGLGAVMGSKKLKAVVVNGTLPLDLDDKERIKKTNQGLRESMARDAKALTEAGTACALDAFEALGNMPIKNWYQGLWTEGAAKITGYTFAKTLMKKHYSCGSCMIKCGSVVESLGGPYDGQEIAGPEYETVALMGANLLIDDLKVIIKANELCNRFGMDTISTGGTIGFCMEAWEHGLLTPETTGGINLAWGNGEAAIAVIEAIAENKTPFGKSLSYGVRKAAADLGGKAREFAQEVKGLELPAHDPRANFTLAVAYATNSRGACHLNFTQDYEDAEIAGFGIPKQLGRLTTEYKGAFTAKMQDWACVFDSLCLCKFGRYGGLMVRESLEYLNAATGWDFSIEEMLATGERIFNLKRMYNNRNGISRKDDTLPPRILLHKRGGGTDKLPPLNLMLNEYYAARGWDEFGYPGKDKIRQLDLGEYLG